MEEEKFEEVDNVRTVNINTIERVLDQDRYKKILDKMTTAKEYYYKYSSTINTVITIYRIVRFII